MLDYKKGSFPWCCQGILHNSSSQNNGSPYCDHGNEDEERSGDGPYNIAPNSGYIHNTHGERQLRLEQGAMLPAEHDLEMTLLRNGGKLLALRLGDIEQGTAVVALEYNRFLPKCQRC